MEINKEKLKILHIIPGEKQSNTMIFAKRQVKNLDNFGINNYIYFLSSRTSLMLVLKSILEIKKRIANYNPDIVHAHYGTMTAFIASLVHKNVVITFHGSDLNTTIHDGFFRDVLGRLLSQIAALKAKKIICVSPQLIHKLWWRKKIACVIPVGVADDIFFPIDKIEVRKKLNWDINQYFILFNANNPRIKRLDIAETVINKLNQEEKKFNLITVKGDIDHNNIPLLINGCDCILLCSDTEGSPMIIKEAMSCNVPIISVDVGDVKQRIQDVSNSILVNQDIDQIATAIKTICIKNERTNGRNIIIRDRLTENENVKEILHLYKSILNTQPF